MPSLSKVPLSLVDMDTITKLILALQQIDNIVELTSENEYRQYLYRHLISVKVELERQLKNEHRRKSNVGDSESPQSSGKSITDCR